MTCFNVICNLLQWSGTEHEITLRLAYLSILMQCTLFLVPSKLTAVHTLKEGPKPEGCPHRRNRCKRELDCFRVRAMNRLQNKYSTVVNLLKQ